MNRCLVAGLVLASLVGCASNTTYVYKPSAPAPGVQKLPVKVAVLPFSDATENFTKRGNELFDQEHLMYNLAKAGIGGMFTALTPELWAKAFADDLATSGDFLAVSFVYSVAELKDEDFVIEGAVEKAIFSGTWDKMNEFALRLRAVRRKDNQPVWEKDVTRAWKSTPSPQQCGMLSTQCWVDLAHADLNRVMQNMFAEAGGDLAEKLSSLLGSPVGGSVLRSTGPPATPEPNSMEETIEGILHGK